MNLPNTKIDRNNLLFRLGRLTRRWRQVLDSEVQASGLTDATWRPLIHLHLLGDGVRQKELAASVGIEGPSLVRLLDTLVTKGLVERSEDLGDRRAKQLRLTPAGRDFVSRIREIVMSLENGLLDPFSDDEISRLAELVLRLEASVDSIRTRVKR